MGDIFMRKIVLIILAIIISIFIYKEQKEDIIVIPDSAIRLRVIPNSNSLLDQKMKEKVKKYLEENTYQEIQNNSINLAREEIRNNIPNIDENIKEIFTNNDYNMTYDINYGLNYFPEKEYRGIKYKEGYYESLVISIGKGEGDNWWCVLFPNLCLIDLENKEDYEYTTLVGETINKLK